LSGDPPVVIDSASRTAIRAWQRAEIDEPAMLRAEGMGQLAVRPRAKWIVRVMVGCVRCSSNDTMVVQVTYAIPSISVVARGAAKGAQIDERVRAVVAMMIG
jgi:hypothetical protein